VKNEEILQLAREVHLDMLHIGRDLSDKRVIAFANAVRNKTLDEAVWVCNGVANTARPSTSSHAYQQGAINCAAAIREKLK